MTDLSNLSDDQLQALHAHLSAQPQPAADLSTMSDEDLQALHDHLASQDDEGPLDKAADAVKSGVGSVMAGPVGKGIQWAGDKLERYVDAPFRAELGALQDGKSLEEARAAESAQRGQDALPTTPSARDIMAKTGLPTTPLSDVAPGMYTPDGKGFSLQKGGPLDPSLAGIAGAVIQPSMWAIPGEALTSGTGKVLGGAAELAGKAAPYVEAAQDAAKSGIFKAGEALTSGNLDAAKAAAATDRLTGMQTLFPNLGPLAKAGEGVGAARDAIAAAQPTIDAATAQPVLQNVRDILTEGERRALRTPQSQAVLEKVNGLIGQGGDVALQDVDDLVRNIDQVGYTPLGNSRQLDPMWKGPVTQARGALNDLLPETMEGQALQDMKTHFSDLSTVAKGRSKLMDGLATVGAAGATAAMAAGAIAHNPLATMIGVGGAAVSKAMSPSTYYQIVGLGKLIGPDAVQGLRAAGMKLEKVAGSKYMAPIMAAAQRGGPQAVAVTHYLMSQQDKDYQDLNRDDQDTSQDAE